MASQPLVAITIDVRGGTHERSIQELERCEIPNNKVITLMKHIQRIAITYLTNLVLNKTKLESKQPLTHRPPLDERPCIY